MKNLIVIVFINLALQGCATTTKASPKTLGEQQATHTPSGSQATLPNQDTKKLIDLLQSKAEKGNPIALYHLGNIYAEGVGDIKKDPALSIMYFKQSAERGHAKAQYNIGASYKLGDGLPQSNKDAKIWYEKAASQGYADAQVQLGLIYLDTEPRTALKWFQAAAMQGSTDGQFLLASMYIRGEGVPQNQAEAYVWMSIAAASGDKDAKTMRDNIKQKLSSEALSKAQSRSITLFNKIKTD
tara:strand:+ start:1369 stop:2091 length:723 start_codon:yes stop_codon:yes gene_type:complete